MTADGLAQGGHMTAPEFPALITAAGHASRFRPFSTTVPKEMLPLGARPALDHVIDECAGAGVSEVIIVTRPTDTVVAAHLAATLGRAIPVQVVAEDLRHGYGNATPLLTVGDRLRGCDLFAVAFGDDVLLPGFCAYRELASMYRIAALGADAVIAAQRVERHHVKSFGIIDTEPDDPTRVIRIRQRPDPATVTEPLAVVSRLVLRPSIISLLVPTERARGEVDLGIAVGELALTGIVRVHRINCQWVTVGDPASYYQALRTYWSLHPEDIP
ncbi:MAG: sugar phosphate nucleotidyltransferase [Pseudonocardiaceae bacterium]